jgi:hypothetical protein
MIDWTTAANGWESVVTGGVQILIVLLAAFLTWRLTRSSERRRGKEEAEAEYQRQIDQYYEVLQETSERLEGSAEEHGSIDADALRALNRWLSRVTWLPRHDHRIVDAWVRTQLLRIPGRFTYLSENDLWDEVTVWEVRQEIKEIGSQFAGWIDGKVPLSWFLDDYNQGGMKMWMGRIGKPNEEAPSRAARLRTAFRGGWNEVRRAWRTPE